MDGHQPFNQPWFGESCLVLNFPLTGIQSNISPPRDQSKLTVNKSLWGLVASPCRTPTLLAAEWCWIFPCFFLMYNSKKGFFFFLVFSWKKKFKYCCSWWSARGVKRYRPLETHCCSQLHLLMWPHLHRSTEAEWESDLAHASSPPAPPHLLHLLTCLLMWKQLSENFSRLKECTIISKVTHWAPEPISVFTLSWAQSKA